MLHFIICEDEPELLNEYIRQIEKIMMLYDVEYKYHTYTCYDKTWKKEIKEIKGFKIYILDIKTDCGSGISAARQIREEFDDWVSMIIMISAYTEYKYEVLSKRLMLVDFINKNTNFEKKLRAALLISLKHYDNKYKSLKYSYKNNVYNIEFRSIIKIEKETDSKRCIIYTEEGEYPIQGTVDEVLSQLDNRFFKCNRAVIINIEQVKRYNVSKNIAILKNGEEFKDISRAKKKEMIKRVRGLQ